MTVSFEGESAVRRKRTLEETDTGEPSNWRGGG